MSTRYYTQLSSMLNTKTKLSSIDDDAKPYTIHIDIVVSDLKTLKSNTVTDEIISELSAFLDITSEVNGLTPQNLILVITQMMSMIGKYKKIPGSEKKNVILVLIKNKIPNLDIDDDVKRTLSIMIHEAVPPAIEVLVDIAKGRYKFKYIPKIYKYLKKICCCCK